MVEQLYVNRTNYHIPPFELLAKYPSARHDLSVHLMPDNAMLFWFAPEEKDKTFNGEGSGYLPLEFARYLTFVDGKTSVNDIIVKYCDEYGKDFMREWITGTRFFQSFSQNGRLTISDTIEPSASPVRITGSVEYYIPTNLMIELTTCCNLQCGHCYCDSNPYRKETIPTDDLLKVLDILHRNGLHSVELTGGEPFMHPDIEKILDFCAERFSPLGILTNGTLIHESRADHLAKFKDQIVCNVSLDSSIPEIHDEIRGVPGSWERTVKGIRRLTERGILVRVAMCVYEKTVTDIERTLILSRSLGARWFTHNSVSPWGRGKTAQWEMSRVKHHELMEEFEKIKQEKYADMMTFIPQSMIDQIVEQGCGAGVTSYIVGANGDVRPCVILGENYLTFGNIFQQSLKQILGSETAIRWRSIKLPNKESCAGCRYQSYCQYCIAKGIMLSEAFSDGCKWARQYNLVHWISHPGQFLIGQQLLTDN